MYSALPLASLDRNPAPKPRETLSVFHGAAQVAVPLRPSWIRTAPVGRPSLCPSCSTDDAPSHPAFGDAPSILRCWRCLLNANLIPSEKLEIPCAQKPRLLLFLSQLPSLPHLDTDEASRGSPGTRAKGTTGIHRNLSQAVFLAAPAVASLEGTFCV